MSEDAIAEVGIDEEARLYVRPASLSFDFIYRAAMEVNWDPVRRRLFSPRPREWTYLQWFQQILAAVADEYGVSLRLTPSTSWSNLSDALRTEIDARARP